ncbi:MAG: lysostaphin resistance A-like protein [Pseudothermotoga sp.]
MVFLIILIILSGMMILQNLSKLFRRNKLLFVTLCQLSYSIILFIILRVPYTFKVQFKGFVPFLLVFGIMVFLGGFLGAEQIRFYKKISSTEIILIGILLPISEEIIFRGVILSFLPNIFLNALIFSCIHLVNAISKMERLSPFNFVYRFIVGYIFAYSVMNTQSLFCGILSHVMNNSVGLLLLSRFEHVTKESTDTTEHKDS